MNDVVYKGIDLSRWNGEVNFKELKNGSYDFVILRAGCRDDISFKDPKFEEYYQQAKDANLEIGCYWFSYATNKKDAEIEANVFLEVIKDKKFSFPCYLCVNDEKTSFSINKAKLTSIVNHWCSKIEEAGYMAGFYTSYEKTNHFNLSEIRYEKWLSKCSKSMDGYSNDVWSIWQYAVIGNSNDSTQSGEVPGCTNGMSVNADYSYKDYPNIIGISFNESNIKQFTLNNKPLFQTAVS